MNKITPEQMEEWKRIATLRGWIDLHPYFQSYDRERPNNYSGLEGKINNTDGTKDVPRWTTDLTAAWTLVEEMPTFVSVIREKIGGYYCGCQGFVDEQGDEFVYEAAGDTAPEAIARCWLAWKTAATAAKNTNRA